MFGRKVSKSIYMNTRKILLWVFGIISIIFIVAGSLYAVFVRPFMKEMMVMHTIPYDKQLTIVLGGGGNSGILVSDSLVLVVDSKMDEAATQFYDQVKQLAGSKPIILVNTHIHPDHAKGNKYYKGQTIIAGANNDKANWTAENGEGTLPTVWVKDSLTFSVGDETVTVFNLPFAAHTQSDVFVYLHNRKLIFTGDVVLNKACPALFAKYNATSAGYMAAFDLAEKRFDIKTVVPGHGPVGGIEVIDNFRQFFKDMTEAAHNDAAKGNLIAKYASWKQVPFVMSPGAAVSYIKAEKK
jgi:cyclase